MRATPTIPAWIREGPPTAAYTNIFALEPCRNETRLYGTESLYGDWDGQLLLLAKDFAPRQVIEARIQRDELRGDTRSPYRHEDEPGMGYLTNRNLRQLADRIDCGKLYGSALAGLLRNDGKTSGRLPDLSAVMPYAQRVLREFTVPNMPNLRGIACLGSDAWACTVAALGKPDVANCWTSYRDRAEPVEIDGLLVFALYHTRFWPRREATRTSFGKQRVTELWASMCARLGMKHRPVPAYVE